VYDHENAYEQDSLLQERASSMPRCFQPQCPNEQESWQKSAVDTGMSFCWNADGELEAAFGEPSHQMQEQEHLANYLISLATSIAAAAAGDREMMAAQLRAAAPDNYED
jgi:hypothetical protein